jgi:hypothetical protein
VDDWFHARSRRARPLHRRLMDDAATAELPARSPARPRRDARRAPAVQYVSRWAHDLDMSRLWRRGVWAVADRRLPDSRRCGSGALRRSVPTPCPQFAHIGVIRGYPRDTVNARQRRSGALTRVVKIVPDSHRVPSCEALLTCFARCRRRGCGDSRPAARSSLVSPPAPPRSGRLRC